MTPTLTRNQDALAGLLFILLGAAGFAVALGYRFGTTGEMGPGYFPRILSLVLVAFGILTFVRGLRRGTEVEGAWAWLPLALLTVGIALFGALVERLGLVPALAALFLVSAYAGHEFRLLEVAVLAVVMCLFATAVFVWGLGLPYSLFAWNL